MTNQERIQARIARDKVRRQQRKALKNQEYDDFSKVITMQHYVESLNKCKKNVNWKGSVQEYCQNAVSEINTTITTIESGKLPKLMSTKQIELYERGKRRIITPVTIRDRMTQRVLCDNALVPVLKNTLIYDNGASMPDKGVEFARRRLDKQIKAAIREYGTDFYALTFDFKSFFDSIPHKTCLKVLNENFEDRYIKGIVMAIIKSYQEPGIMKEEDVELREKKLYELKHNMARGICLGSQISQIMALAVPNKLDHFVKDKRSVKYYIRYMDDGVILSNDKQFLHNLYQEMKLICDDLGLVFNERKTKVVKMSRGFVFLKVRYRVAQSGKVLKTLTRAGIVRMRRKLKKFRKQVDIGKMSYDDVFNSFQSWLAHSKIAMSYNTKKSMFKLYNELYDGYKVTKKYERIKGGKVDELLQTDKWHEYRWNWLVA